MDGRDPVQSPRKKVDVFFWEYGLIINSTVLFTFRKIFVIFSLTLLKKTSLIRGESIKD